MNIIWRTIYYMEGHIQLEISDEGSQILLYNIKGEPGQ